MTTKTRTAPRGLTAERAAEVLSYDPETGIFLHKLSRGGKKAGEVAGCVHRCTGYIYVTVDDHNYLAHQTAWLIMTGEWPGTFLIDHRDLDKVNNRWANLRPSTQSQQEFNKGIRSDNVSGAKGVCWSTTKHRWRAYISVSGRQTHVGYFNSFSEAAAARWRASQERHGEFARAA